MKAPERNGEIPLAPERVASGLAAGCPAQPSGLCSGVTGEGSKRDGGARDGGKPQEVAGLSPMEEAFYGPEARWECPSSIEELAEVVREAGRDSHVVVPSGLGAHAYLGNPPPAGSRVVSLRRLDKILHYEPDDFTVSVQAGVVLADLRRILQGSSQELPVDLPADAPGTVGGLVSAAQPGPRLGSVGPLRAHVVGVRGLGGGGTPYKAGGTVLKNVAGYEVAKFLAGALGTAGFVVDVHLKLKPIPGRRTAGVAGAAFGAEAWELLRRLRRIEPAAAWKLSGDAVTALRSRGLFEGSAPHAVAWILEGSPGSVDGQEKAVESILAQLSADACAKLPPEGADSLADFLCAVPYPGATPPLDLGIARMASLPSQAKNIEEAVLAALQEIEGVRASVAADGVTGLVTVRWSGAPPRIGAPVPALRRIARDARIGGKLVYLPPQERRSQDYLLAEDPNARLAARILGAFDPAGIFASGRLLRRGQAERASGSRQRGAP